MGFSKDKLAFFAPILLKESQQQRNNHPKASGNKLDLLQKYQMSNPKTSKHHHSSGCLQKLYYVTLGPGFVILGTVRELLYQAAEHFKQGKMLSDQGNLRDAVSAYGKALHDLHAVKPQRMRDVLLAQVYLSRYQLERQLHDNIAMTDLRLGYSYARTAREPSVQALAEKLWHEAQ